LYAKRSNNEVQLIRSLYVDDFLVISNSPDFLSKFEHDMETQFEMIDLEEFMVNENLSLNDASGKVEAFCLYKLNW